MSVLNTDYIGFTYNGVHSSDLGILRVSNGSRYDEFLLPPSQDKTVQVPGGDGTYFFGSYYNSRIFQIQFAFDSVSEEQIRKMKQLFGDKKIHPLIFDECPYKTYYAKVTDSATLSYVAFEEGPTNRIYKGEGTLQLTAFNPFAKVTKKFLSEYDDVNKQEWAKASGLLTEQSDFDKFINKKIQIYNPGDLESDWILKIPFIDSKIPETSIYIQDRILGLEQVERKEADDYVEINTKNQLIEGYKTISGNPIKTGNVYNKYIKYGDFFKIPKTKNSITYMQFDDAHGFCGNLLNESQPLIYYYYYY